MQQSYLSNHNDMSGTPPSYHYSNVYRSDARTVHELWEGFQFHCEFRTAERKSWLADKSCLCKQSTVNNLVSCLRSMVADQSILHFRAQPMLFLLLEGEFTSNLHLLSFVLQLGEFTLLDLLLLRLCLPVAPWVYNQESTNRKKYKMRPVTSLETKIRKWLSTSLKLPQHMFDAAPNLLLH